MREHYDEDVNDPHYWPVNMPSRDQVAAGFRLLGKGVAWTTVARRTGLTLNRVQAMRRWPHLYDPVDDEVAIERALDGDHTVLPHLTAFERQTVLERIVHRYMAEEDWLSGLLDGWRLTNPGKFRNRIERAANRRRLREAA